MGATGRAWSAGWMLARRELLRFYRQRSRVVAALGQPLLFWAVIGSGIGASVRPSAVSASGGYLEYFYPGTVVLVMLFTAIFSTISIIEDRREGFLQGVFVAPVPRSGIVLGKTLGGSLLALLQGALLVLLAPLVGVPIQWSGLPLAFGVLFAIAFWLTALGVTIAWRMESIQGFHAIMMFFLMPLWLLSGAFFPAEGVPGWLGWIMRLNPLTYGLNALRHGLFGAADGAASASLELSLGVTLLACVVCMTTAVQMVRRRSPYLSS